ncbi:hypothetical protein Vi05172_g821 [Venturia inaequalis]|nr:hypothetical protein Vi05172_g821 [Venturia inaequalis]
MVSSGGGFYFHKTESRPVFVLTEPDNDNQVEVVGIAAGAGDDLFRANPFRNYVLWPLSEMLLISHRLEVDGRKHAFSALLPTSSHVVLKAFPCRYPFESLTPIYATREITAVLYRKGGASHSETKSFKERVSVSKDWFDAMKTEIRELEIIGQFDARKETKEFKKSMASLESQLRVAKDKNCTIKAQLKITELHNDTIERRMSRLLCLDTNATKSERFEPMGKLYNLVPLTPSNRRDYEEMPTGVRGHMVVVLGTAYHENPCSLWAITVTTKTRNRDIKFHPIYPTPKARHELQVCCERSEVWDGGSPFEQDSYLRMEPFLVPFHLLSSKTYTRLVCDSSGDWVVKEEQPKLTELSMREMVQIEDDDERSEKELKCEGW